jgi:N-acyl homoserine lactone hydrolase
VPTVNSDVEESRNFMERIEPVAHEETAQLCLNHDIVQTATIPHAPS